MLWLAYIVTGLGRVSFQYCGRDRLAADITFDRTMFMSATDEEMHRADDLGIDHVTYALFVS